MKGVKGIKHTNKGDICSTFTNKYKLKIYIGREVCSSLLFVGYGSLRRLVGKIELMVYFILGRSELYYSVSCLLY